jgi:hypothetical protein
VDYRTLGEKGIAKCLGLLDLAKQFADRHGKRFGETFDVDKG